MGTDLFDARHGQARQVYCRCSLCGQMARCLLIADHETGAQVSICHVLGGCLPQVISQLVLVDALADIVGADRGGSS